ncbi:phosphatidylglycerophosphatase A family protein [Insolitispirillum peregrinum]|uniref:Phosphatidylglycerophosphatase A n=1 Tax=Insolitispirillum peregrinum TaxID=80876 RepID=A0A1N7IUQ5_9PROT|nr:phosphatidylglycerophosphatase A [Insolitispirillum peregrinum]SIS40822.1 phosphatidylglycerophosphatase [Insolitispirillum peregrinum]
MHTHPPAPPAPPVVERGRKTVSFALLMLVTWLGSGLSPKAPGTFGTLAALPFAWGIITLSGDAHAGYVLLSAALTVFVIGWWGSALYVRKTNTQDPGLIVIDEVAGVWMTIALCLLSVGQPAYILSFVAFRIFDILKPWPICWFDRSIHGGLGIMLDDLLAGALAAIPIIIILSLTTLPLP